MSLLDLQKLVREKFKFFFRVFKIARTWGLLNILKFVPYEIFYGLKYKVSTLFSINHQELDVSLNMKKNSTEYFPTPYYIASKVFRLVEADLMGCEFVDFGCGAGRILLFASQFGPKKIIGVEFSEILCKQAEKNLNSHFNKYQNLAPDWEIVHGDALKYSISPSTNVFFFYDPFNERTMRKVVDKINLSITEHPRSIKIIYISPAQRGVFIECGYKIMQSSVNKYHKGYIIFQKN
tara:strand:+ start:1306 stop:2013 length:708 start_codon:yes stop_codon:yes gene_type:complete